MTKDDSFRGVMLVGGPCDGERHVVRRGQTVLGFAEKPQMENEITRLRGLLQEARALGCPVYAHHDLCTRIDAALKGNQ